MIAKPIAKSSSSAGVSIRDHYVLLMILVAVMFPGLFTAMQVLNFLHFGLVLAAFVFFCLIGQLRRTEMLRALWVLLVVLLASALINIAGLVNVLLDFLLFA